MKNVEIENAKLMFRNFSGRESQFNRAGDRNVCVRIESEADAQELANEGWNIKMLPPREEGDEPRYYIQVKIGYDKYPPKVVLITDHSKTILGEDTIESLDYAEIRSCDIVIRPYTWEVNGKKGIKAYLKALYVVIEEDSFAAKYDDNDQVPW